MPFETAFFWGVCMLSGFIWGIYMLIGIEKSGVKRWGGGTGSIFKLEHNDIDLKGKK